ncbi:MAG: hypothetical protein IKU86_12220 [Thermoguttaceae bacterium]|nr:hypothetical protein [Thermoguttaceae bacterium]
MSEPAYKTTGAATIDNMNLIKASWGDVPFECKSKNLPSLQEAKTWGVKTDRDAVGRTVAGPSEGFEKITLALPSCPANDYGYFMYHRLAGTRKPLVFDHDHPDHPETITVKNTQIIDVKPGGNENDNSSDTGITFLITDGLKIGDDISKVIEVTPKTQSTAL